MIGRPHRPAALNLTTPRRRVTQGDKACLNYLLRELTARDIAQAVDDLQWGVPSQSIPGLWPSYGLQLWELLPDPGREEGQGSN